ncbi:hypothetical protein [Streptomyces cinereoruber]
MADGDPDHVAEVGGGESDQNDDPAQVLRILRRLHRVLRRRQLRDRDAGASGGVPLCGERGGQSGDEGGGGRRVAGVHAVHGAVAEHDFDVVSAVGPGLLDHREGDLHAGAAVDDPETAVVEHGLDTIAADQDLRRDHRLHPLPTGHGPTAVTPASTYRRASRPSAPYRSHTCEHPDG